MAYSRAIKHETLIRLAINQYDYEKTAEQTGISSRTIRRWDKNIEKFGIPELLERAIERLLMVIPSNMDGQQWAIALGILMDKWLLIQGKATHRIASMVEFIEQMPDSELDELIKEFERAAQRESDNEE